MNLTWHIIKKDLRALKWPLLLWLLLIVAKLGAGVTILTADGTEPPEWFTRMEGMSKVLAAFECVSFVLVAALIQEDLMVGTKAFWVTRPISGGRLLRAKLLTLILVFGVLPLLITLPWWLGCGYGLREIGWAALETSALHAVCVLLGLLWSVVTDGFARFLMWTLVTLFTIPTLSGTLAYYATRGQAGPSGELVSTRFVVGFAIGVLGILVVVAHQYLTRKTVRSIVMISSAAGLIVLVGAYWPWSWNIESRIYAYILRQDDAQWLGSAEPAGLKFTLESAQMSTKSSGSNDGNVRVKYRVEGLAVSQALVPHWTEQTLRWADGTTRTAGVWSRSSMAEIVSEVGLGVAMNTLSEKRQYADTVTTSSWIPAQIATRLQSEPPGFTLPARLQLMRFDSAVPVPMQRGSRNQYDAFGERIAHVEKSGEELLVTFIRHNHSIWMNNFGGRYTPSEQYTQYLLVNRALNFVHRGRPIDRRSTRVATVNIDWHTQSYHASSKAGGPRPLLEAINALNDAELMKVTFVEQARFTHEIKTEALVVEVVTP